MKISKLSHTYTYTITLVVSLCNAIPLWKHSILKRSSSAVVQFELNPNLQEDMVQQEQAKAGILQNDAKYHHECKEPITDASAGVNMRSTCPWSKGYNHDAMRFPMNIPVAILKCGRYCLPENSTDHGVYECVPVNQPMTVLYQTGELNNAGNLVYEEQEKSVTVGYTCAGRKSSTLTAEAEALAATTTTQGTPRTTTEDFFNK